MAALCSTESSAQPVDGVFEFPALGAPICSPPAAPPICPEPRGGRCLRDWLDSVGVSKLDLTSPSDSKLVVLSINEGGLADKLHKNSSPCSSWSNRISSWSRRCGPVSTHPPSAARPSTPKSTSPTVGEAFRPLSTGATRDGAAQGQAGQAPPVRSGSGDPEVGALHRHRPPDPEAHPGQASHGGASCGCLCQSVARRPNPGGRPEQVPGVQVEVEHLAGLSPP